MEKENVLLYTNPNSSFSHKDYFPDFLSQTVMSEKHSKFHKHYYDSGTLGTT